MPGDREGQGKKNRSSVKKEIDTEIKEKNWKGLYATT